MNESGEDVRCKCGRLIARRKAYRFEVKCPRCKEHNTLHCHDEAEAAQEASSPARSMNPS